VRNHRRRSVDGIGGWRELATYLYLAPRATRRTCPTSPSCGDSTCSVTMGSARAHSSKKSVSQGSGTRCMPATSPWSQGGIKAASRPAKHAAPCCVCGVTHVAHLRKCSAQPMLTACDWAGIVFTRDCRLPSLKLPKAEKLDGVNIRHIWAVQRARTARAARKKAGTFNWPGGKSNFKLPP